MSTTKAIAFTAPRRAELIDRQLDDSPLGPTEILSRTQVSLISPGTELNWAYYGIRESQKNMSYPVSTGYACVSEVEAVGAEIKDLKPGDRIFAMVNHAARHRIRRDQCTPLPAGLDAERALYARFLAISWTTLTTTIARPPDRVLVTGLGLVGHCAALLFQAAGYRVTAVDPVASRRDLAQGGGITDCHATVPAEGRPFRLAVECSGHEQAVLDGAKAVRKGGEAALIGVPWKKRSDLPMFELLNEIFHNYVTVRSGWEWELPTQPRDFTVGSFWGNLAGALAWLAEGRIRIGELARRVSPAEAGAAYESLGTGSQLTVLFDWGCL